jgi:hypothetical protein
VAEAQTLLTSHGVTFDPNDQTSLLPASFAAAPSASAASAAAAPARVASQMDEKHASSASASAKMEVDTTTSASRHPLPLPTLSPEEFALKLMLDGITDPNPPQFSSSKLI